MTLGWEVNEREWDRCYQQALADRYRAWVVQERIAVRREIFPMQTAPTVSRCATCSWTSRLTFSAAKWPGFLTRLSVHWPRERDFRRRPGSRLRRRSTLMNASLFRAKQVYPRSKKIPAIYNDQMKFGSVHPELLPGARNAIETCLAIQPGERVTLIADRASAAVAASLAEALDQRGAIARPFLLEDLASRPLNPRPASIARVARPPTREFSACSRSKVNLPRAKTS